jgi:subtilisin family serine protease
VTIIAASGNQGKNLDVEKVYPASFEHKNVITVGAFDEAGKVPSWVNRGKAVDVFAPGANIIGNTGKDEFGFVNGTSFSAPIFASYLIAEIAKGKTLTTILNSLPTSNILKAISFDGKSVAIPGNVSVEELKKYTDTKENLDVEGTNITPNGFTLQGVNPNLGSISSYYPDGSQGYPINYTNGNISFGWSSVDVWLLDW